MCWNVCLSPLVFFFGVSFVYMSVYYLSSIHLSTYPSIHPFLVPVESRDPCTSWAHWPLNSISSRWCLRKTVILRATLTLTSWFLLLLPLECRDYRPPTTMPCLCTLVFSFFLCVCVQGCVCRRACRSIHREAWEQLSGVLSFCHVLCRLIWIQLRPSGFWASFLDRLSQLSVHIYDWKTL